jgi:hypothetical protein
MDTTPMHLAAERGHAEIWDLLLLSGAAKHEQDKVSSWLPGHIGTHADPTVRSPNASNPWHKTEWALMRSRAFTREIARVLLPAKSHSGS